MIKEIQLTLLCLLFCCVGFAQTTAIPDPNFEQALINQGYDTGVPNGSVLTANISGLTALTVSNANIISLVGIEDFTALLTLNCSSNDIDSLDLSQNTALTDLFCFSNELTTLDVSLLSIPHRSR